MQVADQYRDRIEHFAGEHEELDMQYRRISYLRLGTFVLVIAVFIWLVQHQIMIALVWLVAGIAVFGRVMAWHESFKERADRAKVLQQINKYELQSAGNDHSWNDDGEQFIDQQHPYSGDLDIYGEASLFQLINRAQTGAGRRIVAEWLQQMVGWEEIRSRQVAMRELASEVDFRQSLQMEGVRLKSDESDFADLQAWIKSPNLLLGKSTYLLAIHILPFIILPATLAVGYYWGLDFAWLPLIVPGIILWKSKKAVDEVHKRSGAAGDVLSTHSEMLGVLEGGEWSAERLKEIHSRILTGKDQKASKIIRKLSYAIRQLNVRDNFFAILFNLFGFWDLHWVYRMEKLKLRLENNLLTWFDALGEMEALCSLANLARNNPEWVVPSLATEDNFSALDLGHPLIPRDKRIDNSLTMPLQGHIKLITGSNMAGKSTFLRSVGTNLVLAMAGGVVCAREMHFRPTQIYTSMRTADDLGEGASTFYSELARLKMIINATEQDAPVLFLLDEILKGTNSGDRHRGSRALIKQLINNLGAGLVATHDLALTTMEAEAEGKIENWYFDVVIENDRLAFDYRIKRGICDSFNASHLMKKMGIALEELD